ncbi:MAG: GNAT family N-acetyltransferase [Lachnospiraceae bacterium]
MSENYRYTKIRKCPEVYCFATTKERLDWQLNEEHRPMYGYYLNGELTGCYSLRIQDHHECELNNLCVLPQHRHRKIGCQLLENAFENARNMNCTIMHIGIVEEIFSHLRAAI